MLLSLLVQVLSVLLCNLASGWAVAADAAQLVGAVGAAAASAAVAAAAVSCCAHLLHWAHQEHCTAVNSSGQYRSVVGLLRE